MWNFSWTSSATSEVSTTIRELLATSKQIAEIQCRDQAIGQVQQEFQSLLGAPRRLKIDGIVHGERDLVGNQRKELYLVF